MQQVAATLLYVPIRSARHWGIILIIALAALFAPNIVTPNDWELNAAPLPRGLAVYQNDFVMPPWSLVFFWPYYLLNVPGTRFVTVLILGWLSARCGWTLLRFFAMIVSPFFAFALLFSNSDVLVWLLPILLLEATPRLSWPVRVKYVVQAVALTLTLIKPQAGLGIVLLWLLTRRRAPRELLNVLGIVFLLTVPISLIGTPPLIQQWLQRITEPPSIVLGQWSVNNVSLTAQLGLGSASLIVVLALGLTYGFFRWRGLLWTRNHSYSAVILATMLLSPYASHQGGIVPAALVTSWSASLIQLIGSVGGHAVGLYEAQHQPLWFLVFGLTALLCFHGAAGNLESLGSDGGS